MKIIENVNVRTIYSPLYCVFIILMYCRDYVHHYFNIIHMYSYSQIGAFE